MHLFQISEKMTRHSTRRHNFLPLSKRFSVLTPPSSAPKKNMATILTVPLSQPLQSVQELERDTCQSFANMIRLGSSAGLTQMDRFCSETAPTISVTDYIVRFYHYGGFSPTCFIAARTYLTRFITITQQNLHELNIHRLLAVAILCAVKYLEDKMHNNRIYAEISGLSVTELNHLEGLFLSVLNFDLSLPEFNRAVIFQMNNLNSL